MAEQKLSFRWLVGPELSNVEEDLIAQFDKDIFIPSFPNDDERESIDDIKSRIKDHQKNVRTLIAFMFESDDKGSDCLIAGEICDWYPATGDLEIIYLAVKPSCRQKGLGQRILREGTAGIVQAIECGESTTVRRIYFETENPKKDQKADAVVMPIYDGLRFFGRNGGSVVLEDYYQPPLSPGKNWAENMMLCTLPVFRYVSGESEQERIVEAADMESSVSRDELRQFLTIFYQGLGVAYTEEGRQKLNEMLTPVKTEKGKIQLKRIEVANFRIPYAAISSHYFIKGTNLDIETPDSVFNSYESDLMQYGMQDYLLRPVVTHHNKRDQLTLLLPEEYQFESEGKCFVAQNWKNQAINVQVSFNWSYHRKYHGFLATLVITPDDGSAFTEWDILKIIALMGFGSKQENF